MSQILTLLFDAYTQEQTLSRQISRATEPEIQFQRLKELAGERAALEIWDAAAGEGAEWEEVCFWAGLKAGLQMALELLDL